MLVRMMPANLTHAFESNTEFRDRYRRMIQCLLGLSFLALILLSFFIYQLIERPGRGYYATTGSGQLIKLYPLDEPVVTNHYVLQWAATVARAAYSMNFINYERQFKEKIIPYFTDRGWEILNDQMNAPSGVVTSLKMNKLTMNAVINGAAVILYQGVSSGRYIWRVQLPLLVTYTSASETRRSSYVVTMDIVRVAVVDIARSIQVSDFYVSGQ